jgi:hypothetical protein
MRKNITTFSMLMFLVLTGCGKEAVDVQKNVSASTSMPSACEITSQGIGKILLSDSKESVLKKIPAVKFETSTDHDGVEWLVATYEGVTVFIAEGEFSYLEVQDPMCKTQAGAAVGMKVEQLERIYGRAIRVETNGANSEEEVIFENALKNISFKGYGLGVFRDDSIPGSITEKINSNGIVGMISVAASN